MAGGVDEGRRCRNFPTRQKSRHEGRTQMTINDEVVLLSSGMVALQGCFLPSVRARRCGLGTGARRGGGRGRHRCRGRGRGQGRIRARHCGWGHDPGLLAGSQCSSSGTGPRLQARGDEGVVRVLFLALSRYWPNQCRLGGVRWRRRGVAWGSAAPGHGRSTARMLEQEASW
jgi:hypothetical protein